MASEVTWSTIHLGSMRDLDSYERSSSMEHSGDLIRTYGSAEDRLSEHVTEVTTHSSHDTTVDFDNTRTSDTISYDLGDGPQTTQIDSGASVSGTVTFTDGSTYTGSMAVVQDTEGNLFLLVSDSQTELVSKPIETLEITSVNSSRYDGAYQTTRDDLEFVCFAPGTRVATPGGPRAVEDLSPGDLVDTVDHGPQPLLWRGERTLQFGAEAHRQKPVLVARGAFGDGLPECDLVISPQHRVLLSGAGFRDRLGNPEVLVPAKALLKRPGIRQMNGRRKQCYVTLLFQRHEVIRAEGALVESFYPGAYALTLLDPAQRAGVFGLFPRLRLDPVGGYGPPARPLLARRPAEKLVALPETCLGRAAQTRAPEPAAG